MNEQGEQSRENRLDIPQVSREIDSGKVPVSTPDGEVVHYPLQLELLAHNDNKYSIFMTRTFGLNKFYIATTGMTEVKFRLSDTPDNISDMYEAFPFPEQVINDENGRFYYKEVPDGLDLDEYFKTLGAGEQLIPEQFDGTSLPSILDGESTVWPIDDDGPVNGGAFKTIKKFLDEHKHEDYSLSVFDSLSQGVVEIECDFDSLLATIYYIYHLEKGAPLTLIGANPKTKSYVVAMPFTRGRLQLGKKYVDKDGSLSLVE